MVGCSRFLLALVSVAMMLRAMAQCPSGLTSIGPCILQNPGDACTSGDGLSNGSCVGSDCCRLNAVTTAPTSVATSSTANGGSGTGSTAPDGCLGPCFDNSCPTSFTCNTVTQRCCGGPAATTASPSTSCRDLTKADGTSDCTRLSYLCNNTVYYNVMTQQCPRTCNRCSTSSSTGSSGTCVDKTKADGTSDCSRLSYLCNNTVYYTVMTEQCPRTCNRCSSSSGTATTRSSSSSSSCVDKTKADGTSDCASLSYLCNDSRYYSVMTDQCPRTCNRCTSG